MEGVTKSLADHDYLYRCDCTDNCSCSGCIKKQGQINHLVSQLDCLHITKLIHEEDPSNKYISSDHKVRLNTGLPNKQAFHALLNFVSPKATRMRYWHGKSKVISSKVPRRFKAHPARPGPKRKLSVQAELVMVLMKLRLGLDHEFLASLFSISLSSCSDILCMWIKFLANTLRNLVFWPDKETVRKTMLASLSEQYPNLRCTLDCSETFIQRPRDLQMQTVTWSDYKHHNTVKYLVAIAPNGHISFISKAWGGVEHQIALLYKILVFWIMLILLI